MRIDRNKEAHVYVQPCVGAFCVLCGLPCGCGVFSHKHTVQLSPCVFACRSVLFLTLVLSFFPGEVKDRRLSFRAGSEGDLCIRDLTVYWLLPRKDTIHKSSKMRHPFSFPLPFPFTFPSEKWENGLKWTEQNGHRASGGDGTECSRHWTKKQTSRFTKTGTQCKNQTMEMHPIGRASPILSFEVGSRFGRFGVFAATLIANHNSPPHSSLHSTHLFIVFLCVTFIIHLICFVLSFTRGVRAEPLICFEELKYETLNHVCPCPFIVLLKTMRVFMRWRCSSS